MPARPRAGPLPAVRYFRSGPLDTALTTPLHSRCTTAPRRALPCPRVITLQTGPAYVALEEQNELFGVRKRTESARGCPHRTNVIMPRPPSGAKASRIFGPRWACRNGGPTRSSALTARWSVTAHAGRQIRSFGHNCTISPTRGSVWDIVGCLSWCGRRGRRASPRASTASTGFIAKKASRCAATGSERRRGIAGADPGRIQAERSLVG